MVPEFNRRSTSPSQQYGCFTADESGEPVRDYRFKGKIKDNPYVPTKVPQNQRDPRQKG